MSNWFHRLWLAFQRCGKCNFYTQVPDLVPNFWKGNCNCGQCENVLFTNQDPEGNDIHLSICADDIACPAYTRRKRK